MESENSIRGGRFDRANVTIGNAPRGCDHDGGRRRLLGMLSQSEVERMVQADPKFRPPRATAANEAADFWR